MGCAVGNVLRRALREQRHVAGGRRQGVRQRRLEDRRHDEVRHEQSTSSSTDGSSDTASNTSTDSAQSDTTSSSSDGSTDATDTNGQGTDSTASSDAQSTPPATAEANKATSVRVINGTKISGHAASRAYTLKQAGYKNVVSANPSGTLPASTVVWYQNETDAATAKDIAVTLGISDVRQMSGISAPVVVVLMQ